MLETERLLIRKFEKRDWKDLYEYLSDGKVVEFEPYGVFTEEECKREAENRAGNGDFWAVCAKPSMKLIGNVYLSEREFDTWELGYVFNRAYHGRGYATEASEALINYIFGSCEACRVTACCNPKNQASWKLLERLGLRREGHLIQDIYFKKDSDGKPLWSDTYIYGILKQEWAECRKENKVRIGEVGLLTNDVIGIADFYRTLLGINGCDGRDNNVHQIIITEGTGLTIYNDGTEKNNNNENICLAFTVDDVDSEYERLKEMRVKIVEKPETRPWGARNMHFLDPDGNHVYFRSLPKEG